MALLKDSKLVENDPWVFVDADADLPADDAAVAVPLSRFVEQREALIARKGPLGIVVEPGDDPAVLDDDLARFGLIAIDFPTFGDGRGYTHARLLRERLGWSGELRAIGDVLYDQFFFMARVGIDAFDVKKDHDVELFAEAMQEFGNVYQRTVDGRDTIVHKRVHGTAHKD